MLYVVNHGGRESVEVFTITLLDGSDPEVTWIGCVVLPQGTSGNDVVALPDGGLAVTNMFDPEDTSAIAKMQVGENTGNVLEWYPGKDWSVVPGSDLSGPNGIEVSLDGDMLYIGSWSAAKCLVCLSRGCSPLEKRTVATGHLTDNLTWSGSGSLLVTGHLTNPIDFTTAYRRETKLSVPFSILAVDPVSFEVHEIRRDDGRAGFGAGTVALEVGSSIWVGTSRGDRIACFDVRSER
jgi:hypothetical protein